MTDTAKRLSTGVPGLDEVLKGGLIPERAYLVRGGPGTGKTTLGFHFLCEGTAKGERSLFISLTESAEKLRYDALQRGFDVNRLEILDLTPSADSNYEEGFYSVVSAGEVEQEPLLQKITERLNEIQPERVFLDGVTQLQYLAPDNFQFRKRLLSFMDKVLDAGATFLLTSEISSVLSDDDLQFLCDGIFTVELVKEKRQIQVSKFRGSDFAHGIHALRLNENGMTVFPSLNPKQYPREYSFEVISSGIPEVDEILHGGINRGTATVISGPTGVGKSTLGLQFMKEAAGRGERSVIYTFEESVESLQEHCKGINIPITSMLKQGSLSLVKIDPLQYMPDEFSHHVRREVEEMGTEIVMLDSISGYRLSFEKRQDEGYEMLRHLHSLSEYLKSMGVTVILINETQNITGEFKVSDYGISYMADTIVFMRYLEVRGEMKKAMGVLKKRLSNFEKTMREVEITKYGFRVGKPLTGLRGILSGSPEFISTTIEGSK